MKCSINPSFTVPYQRGRLQPAKLEDLQAIKDHAQDVARSLEVKETIDALITKVAGLDEMPEDLNTTVGTVAVLGSPVEYQGASYDRETLARSSRDCQHTIDACLTLGADWVADNFEAQCGRERWSYERVESGNQYYRLNSNTEKLEALVSPEGTLTITTWELRE